MKQTFKHRNLRLYPYGTCSSVEELGVLSQDTSLAGEIFPAGTEVRRDIEFDYVIATLQQSYTVRGTPLPAGTQLHLYYANPRSAVEWLFHIFYRVPLLSAWFAVVGAIELMTGRWRPWRRKTEHIDVWATVYVPQGDDVPEQLHILRDGSVQKCDPHKNIK